MVAKAEVEAGKYRKISGNDALVLGLITGAEKAKRNLLYSGYPITPASSILEGLAAYKHFGVKALQAEDEIAAIGIALGASFAGNLGVTGTSGPGMCLKAEFIGLATATELPLVILNIQRGGLLLKKGNPIAPFLVTRKTFPAHWRFRARQDWNTALVAWKRTKAEM